MRHTLASFLAPDCLVSVGAGLVGHNVLLMENWKSASWEVVRYEHLLVLITRRRNYNRLDTASFIGICYRSDRIVELLGDRRLPDRTGR